MITYQHSSLDNLKLGQAKTDYPSNYDPLLLQAVPRTLNRQQLGIEQHLPFSIGADLWTAFEISWLNPNGLPQVAIGDIEIDAHSEHLVESKSFKLYLNSLNQSIFADRLTVQNTIEQDLSHCVQGKVKVRLISVEDFGSQRIVNLKGKCIDYQEIKIDHYQFDANLLAGCVDQQQDKVEEYLVSHLLKSNCLITQQPDWGTVQIHYVGKPINQEKLLRYIVSFRQHNEFHEQCVERIYQDLIRFARPEKLTVYARYTRRGGLDINPFRSNFEKIPLNLRLIRQ